jgi:hypothetical protein
MMLACRAFSSRSSWLINRINPKKSTQVIKSQIEQGRPEVCADAEVGAEALDCSSVSDTVAAV